MREVYLVDGGRTAVGTFNGTLAGVNPADTAATVIRTLLERQGLKAGDIDEVLLGCVLQGGLGQNISRQAAIRAGVPVEIFDVARTNVSYILPSLWTKKGVLIGAPTYEVALFPPMAHALDMAARKRIKNKTTGYFGSFGWSKGALRETKKIVEPLGWEVHDAFEFNGSAAPKEIHAAEQFGYKFGLSCR